MEAFTYSNIFETKGIEYIIVYLFPFVNPVLDYCEPES